jgi:hypothetical protein
MFNTGDIVQLVYGHHAYSLKPPRYEEIGEPTLFLLHHADGHADVLRPDGRTVTCSTTQLRLCASVQDREYTALRDFIFPEQQEQAA